MPYIIAKPQWYIGRHCICGVMFSVLVLSAVDCEFKSGRVKPKVKLASLSLSNQILICPRHDIPSSEKLLTKCKIQTLVWHYSGIIYSNDTQPHSSHLGICKIYGQFKTI